jgi:hypothetical protein
MASYSEALRFLAIPVGIPVTGYHRVARGGYPPLAPTERRVRISRTTLVRSRVTA